jgi:hypothetical protein
MGAMMAKVYGYVRLDERKFKNRQDMIAKQNEYVGEIYTIAKPDGGILIDRRAAGIGFHDRPELVNLLGPLTGISKGNPTKPLRTGAGDTIVVKRLTHLSDELGVIGRIVAAIDARRMELVVLDMGINTSAFDAATGDRKNFFAGFASLALLKLHSDKDKAKPKGPIHILGGDGGGDGGGNGGG